MMNKIKRNNKKLKMFKSKKTKRNKKLKRKLNKSPLKCKNLTKTNQFG